MSLAMSPREGCVGGEGGGRSLCLGGPVLRATASPSSLLVLFWKHRSPLGVRERRAAGLAHAACGRFWAGRLLRPLPLVGATACLQRPGLLFQLGLLLL